MDWGLRNFHGYLTSRGTTYNSFLILADKITLIDTVKAEKVRLILVDNFYDPSLPNSIARETGAVVVILPNQVTGEPGINTYFDLMDFLIRKIDVALNAGPAQTHGSNTK